MAGTLSGIIYLHTLTPVLPLRADRDQVAKAWGWDQLGAVVDRNRSSIMNRAAFNVGTLYVAAERYQDVSELAFHLADRPNVLSLNLMGRPNHYDLRPMFADIAKPGDAILLVARNVTETVGTEELKNAVVTLHPQSAAEHLHNLFVAAGGEGFEDWDPAAASEGFLDHLTFDVFQMFVERELAFVE